MSVRFENEFKEIMELNGWKVFKIDGDTSLISEDIPMEVYNFAINLKKLLGKGVPDFFVFKEKPGKGFLVEIKNDEKLTLEQEKKAKMIFNILGIRTFIAGKGNIELAGEL